MLIVAKGVLSTGRSTSRIGQRHSVVGWGQPWPRKSGRRIAPVQMGLVNRCRWLISGLLLPCTQFVERFEHQNDLLSVFGFWVYVLQPIDQRGEFGI